MARGKIIFQDKGVKITWYNKLPELLKSASSRELQNQLQEVVDKQILPLIDKGLSPVQGARTLAKYADKKKYPGKKKQSNKPNLKLTGEMLSQYKAKGYGRGGSLSGTMGIHSDASQRARLLAGVHNYGVQSKNIAMRPFIPKNSQGETFNAKITNAIRKAFRYVLGRALKNNKGRGQK